MEVSPPIAFGAIYVGANPIMIKNAKSDSVQY